MRVYAGLAASLVCGGIFIPQYFRQQFSVGAWYTAAVLLVFALLARAIVVKEQK
jgi:hypothetical protein